MQKRYHKQSVFLMVSAMAGAAALPALGEVYTFQPTSGVWNDENNWRYGNNQIGGYPDDDEDDAIIPAGMTVNIPANTISITGSINVQQHENGTRGVVAIHRDNGELRLGNDRDVESVVNGFIVFLDCPIETSTSCPTQCPSYSCPAIIRLMHDEVTITSDPGMNGEIRGHKLWSNPDWYYPNTPGDSGGYIYTDEDQPYILHLEGSVRLVGTMGVYCPLDNNATVIVDDPRGVGDEAVCETCPGSPDCSCDPRYFPAPMLCWKDEMILATPDGVQDPFEMTGTGDWIVTGGTMTFENCIIDSAGNWVVRNPCEDLDGTDHSLLEFKADVDVECLSGDFTIYGGKVKIKTDLQTTGKLTFYSPKDAVQPVITVAENKTATFSKVCP
ncbi:MAG: hypothetical protein BroJett003_23000 [Planctomycetota bacterium]|nr:MAG: hypothetical protein BroJett003_23000 [Planctomycetota bacterium]